MPNTEQWDFSGYVTKNDVKCLDGVTIKQDAFAAQNGMVVPLVFEHKGTVDINSILGNVKLENRKDGLYGYGKFNATQNGQNAKLMVAHGDLDSMSIWANRVTKIGNDVVHGTVCEVSLVVKGANPEAKIENVYFKHSDGHEEICDDEMVISYGIPFEGGEVDPIQHSASGAKTIEDVLATLTPEQNDAVAATTAAAIEKILANAETLQHSGTSGGDDIMKMNPFSQGADSALSAPVQAIPPISDEIRHSALDEMIKLASGTGSSLKNTILQHADDLSNKYGITNIDMLFPDAHVVNQTPEFIKRDTTWVPIVLNGVKHAPFSRLKTFLADITHDEARALGYITGNFKKEEYFSVSSRETFPTTVYKKQKFDRDPLIDSRNQEGIISWVKDEMRTMLNEELGRAVLIGDGRPVMTADGKANPDKINEDCIRPIWKEPELYAVHYNIYDGMPTGSDVTIYDKYDHMTDNIIRAMDNYEGSGNTVAFMSSKDLTEILLLKDKLGRKLYANASEFASTIGVDRIVKVPQFKGDLIRTATDKNTGENETTGNQYKLFAIIVDLSDYTIGTDEGGQVSMFDAFDIDYNQYKYLMETRCSGSLMKPKSAIILEIPYTTTPSTPQQPVG